jgi:hypothetical protein
MTMMMTGTKKKKHVSFHLNYIRMTFKPFLSQNKTPAHYKLSKKYLFSLAEEDLYD